MTEQVIFLNPKYLNYLAIALLIAVAAFMCALIIRRRNAPADRKMLVRLGILPSILFHIGSLVLILLTLTGYIGFLAHPVRERKRTVPDCTGAYVVFIRDASDSMKGEKAFYGREPKVSGARINVFWATNQLIRGLVERHDCFKAAMIDFQEYDGVVSGFLPIPDKRAEFLDAIETPSAFAPGSDLLAGIVGGVALIQTVREAKYKSLLVLLSDGGDPLDNAQERNKQKVFLGVSSERSPVIAVGLGTLKPYPLVVYQPKEKKFLPHYYKKSPLMISRYDVVLKEIKRASNGKFLVVERYEDIIPPVEASAVSALDRIFEEYIARHRVIKGYHQETEREDLGWYLFLIGTVAFTLLFGFLNWFFRACAGIRHFISKHARRFAY